MVLGKGEEEKEEKEMGSWGQKRSAQVGQGWQLQSITQRWGCWGEELPGWPRVQRSGCKEEGPLDWQRLQ